MILACQVHSKMRNTSELVKHLSVFGLRVKSPVEFPRRSPAGGTSERKRRPFRVVKTCRRRRIRTVPRAAPRATASSLCRHRHLHRPRRRRASRRRPAAESVYPTIATRPSSTAAAQCWAGRRRDRYRRRPCPSIRRALTPARITAARLNDSLGNARPVVATGSPAWTDSPWGRGYWTEKRRMASPSR